MPSCQKRYSGRFWCAIHVVFKRIFDQKLSLSTFWRISPLHYTGNSPSPLFGVFFLSTIQGALPLHFLENSSSLLYRELPLFAFRRTPPFHSKESSPSPINQKVRFPSLFKEKVPEGRMRWRGGRGVRSASFTELEEENLQLILNF